MTMPPVSLGDALALATIAHHGQTYGTEPYINHPIRVSRLITIKCPYRLDLSIAALLHDVVEDSPITIEVIEDMFGRVVAGIVGSVTRRLGETYFDFVDRAAAHPDGRLIKLADNTDNLYHMRPGDPREHRYIKARKVLVAANDGYDPWEHLVTDEARLDA